MQKLENPRLTYAKIFDVTSKTAIAAVRTRNEEIRKDQIKKGVIHKPCGQIFGHFLPSPPLWTCLLNMGYVLIWTFGKPPSPLPCPHGL